MGGFKSLERVKIWRVPIFGASTIRGPTYHHGQSLDRTRCYQLGYHKAIKANYSVGLSSISVCMQVTTVILSPSYICVAMVYL